MTAADTLFVLAGALLIASGYALGRRRMRAVRLLAAAGTGLLSVECALAGSWFGAAWNAVLLVVLIAWDWRDRRGRKAARQLGAKSRALLAAVVAKAREAGTPLPEGVGA